MLQKLLTRSAALAVLLTVSTALAEEETAPPPPSGLYVQAHAHMLTGWTIMVEEAGVAPETQVKLQNGGGLGLRLGYDFTPHVGLFASAELNAESEGPYMGYGAGVTLRVGMGRPLRLNARLGARVLDPVEEMIYGTAGLGAELFLFRPVSLGLEVDAAVPLTGASRLNGGAKQSISANGGPVRGIVALTWYIGG